MQNRLERKKVCGKWAAQPGSAPAAEGLPHNAGDPRRRRWCGSGRGSRVKCGLGAGYCLASSVVTSFSETELMQKRWSVGVP